MAVTVSFTATQSIDGKTITLTNATTYTGGDVATDYTARFILKDAYGVLLATLFIPAGQTVVTYAVTKDLWLDIELALAGVVSYSKILSFFFFRFTANKLIKINKKGCCLCKTKTNNLTEALRFVKGYEYAAPLGNKVAYQTNIDTANTFLDLAV